MSTEGTTTTISTISEVPCPCKREDKEHFVESIDRYGCNKCNLWLRHTLGGYKLTPQDIYDMIYGSRLGPVKTEAGEIVNNAEGKPVMARWTDYHDFVSKAGKKYSAALAFEPKSNWKIIRRFPERAQSEATGRLCPVCQEEGREGQLVIKQSKKGEKFIACNAYPKCKYTEPYAPFMVKGVEADKPQQ